MTKQNDATSELTEKLAFFPVWQYGSHTLRGRISPQSSLCKEFEMTPIQFSAGRWLSATLLRGRIAVRTLFANELLSTPMGG